MYNNTDRANRLRVGAGWSLPLMVLISLMGISCGVPKPSDEDWQDSTKSLWITVTSIPTGAEVYGVSNDEPGTLLGRTPLTLKFWKAWGAESAVQWQCPNQDASMDEVIEHGFWKATIKKVYMPGTRSRTQATGWTRAQGLGLNRETARIHCYVVKESYKPYLLEDTFKVETVPTDFPNVFEGQKVYNAVLVPLE